MTMRLWFLTPFLLLTSVPGHAQSRSTLGILGQPAPSWKVTQWANLPAGMSNLDIDDLRGKVVYLFGFQSWCPGCHRHGFPTLESLVEQFGDDEDVAFVAIQTVFEGFSSNTFEKGGQSLERYGLNIPFGQSGGGGEGSQLMQQYRTGGTPWSIVIDRKGIVRFNDFFIDTDQAVALIQELREEPSPNTDAAPRDAPSSGSSRVGHRGQADSLIVPLGRSGQDMLHRAFPLDALEWIGDRPEIQGHVTLVRWWTDTCPFCANSLPIIEQLRNDFGPAGLRTVAVYHPKPPRPSSDQAILKVARRLGYSGPLARDAKWSVLREFYLDEHPGVPTSVSFLLDREGRVRWFHPGPDLGAVRETEDNSYPDWEELQKAIVVLLGDR